MSGRNVIVLFLAILGATGLKAQQGAPTRLPVKEVSVFKDGHAFVMREGRHRIQPGASVVLDELPTPILGTFWAYTPEKEVSVRSVTASQVRRVIERTTSDMRRLIISNVGAEILLTLDNERVAGQILEAPTRSGAELESTSTPGSGARLAEAAPFFLMKTPDGTRVVHYDKVQNLTFRSQPNLRSSEEEFRGTLSLQMEGRKPGEDVTVGYVCLEKGLRWFPQYSIEIDGDGTALVTLQASIQNDLVDLQDTLVHLVVGVPSFRFKDMVDPLALQESLMAVRAGLNAFDGHLNNNFASNAIMTQVPGNQGSAGNVADTSLETGRREDLFVFSVDKVTLKKGARLTTTLASVKMRYTDLYRIIMDETPPPDVFNALAWHQVQQLAQVPVASPTHLIRLENSGPFPITTAPAIIRKDGQILGQGMTRYTSIGGKVDIEVASAVEVSVHSAEEEVRRTLNAATRDLEVYAKVEVSGKITVRNNFDRKVTVEVERRISGNLDAASEGAVRTGLSLFEDLRQNPDRSRPLWWSWYGWPGWWKYFNGTARAIWTVTLEPKAAKDLSFSWHYFWR